MIDVSNLTIGEIAKVEDISKLSVSQFGDPETPKARLMIAVGYVLKRREDPNVKVTDIEAMTLDEISTLVGGEDSADA